MKRKIVIECGERNCSAYVPSIGGVAAVGDTIEETKKNMQEAIEFHLECMEKDGDPIPDISGGFYYEIDKMGTADFWYGAMEAFEEAGFQSIRKNWRMLYYAYVNSSAGVRPSDNSPTCHYKLFLKQSGKDKHIRIDLRFGTNEGERNKYLFKALEKAGCITNRSCANQNYATTLAKRSFDGENKESWESTIAWLVKEVRKFDREITPIRQRAETAWERRCHRRAA